MTVEELDVRVGGARRICMEVETPAGPMRMWFTGEHLEVVEPARLVYTESMTDEDGNVTAPPGHPSTTEVRVELDRARRWDEVGPHPPRRARGLARCRRLVDGARQAGCPPRNARCFVSGRTSEGVADESECFVEETAPGAAPFDWDHGPFAKAASRGSERLGATGGHELVDTRLGELDQQVAGAAVAAGEERAPDADAGQTHHRGAGDVGTASSGSVRSSKRLCPVVVAVIVAGGRRRGGHAHSASGSGPGSAPVAATASRAR